MDEEKIVVDLETDKDYLVVINANREVSDYEQKKFSEIIEGIDEDREGNLYGLILESELQLEDADKISQDVVQRIADRVIAQLMEAGNDVGETREQTPLGGKTHS